MKKILLTAILIFFSAIPSQIWAVDGAVLGVHILETTEVDQAAKIAVDNKDGWGYVTIPIRLDQLNPVQWQKFFDTAREKKLIPIVRLATEINKSSWRKPTKADIVVLAGFLSGLDWKTDKRYVIIFNEPNQSKEYGNEIDPQDYAQLLSFACDWFHTDNRGYVVLPAGLDAAAPNGKQTMESIEYLGRMLTAEPDLFNKIDGWTSHAYPNPDFAASAYKNGKNSLWGWKFEWEFIKKKTGREMDIFITETGWDQSKVKEARLFDYYNYAFKNIWSDTRIKAVTPFVLNGNNGIFDGFSLYDSDGSPTPQLEALMRAKAKNMKD
jgi:hypothetical protein